MSSAYSPEIFACSGATESRVGRGIVAHVLLRRPQRGGERAGLPSASTTVGASDGGVKGVVVEAGGEGRHGGGGRRLGVGGELRFHRLS